MSRGKVVALQCFWSFINPYLSSVSVMMERWRPCRMLSRPPWPSGRLVYRCRSHWSSTRPPPSSASSWRSRLQSCWRVSLLILPLTRRLKQVWFTTKYMFRVLNRSKVTSVSDNTWNSRPVVCIFFSVFQMFMLSLIKSNFMSLWHTTSMLVTSQFWRSWPKMWTCVQAATGWLCSIQETSALLTTRSLFLCSLPTLSKCVFSLSNACQPHHLCRRCRSCTRIHLRMTTSWSWCLETFSSCRLWSRAPSVRVGCTAPRWARGCRACCLKTTSTGQMSLIPGSFMGKKKKFQMLTADSGLTKSFQFRPQCTQMTSSESGAAVSSCFPVFLVSGSQVLLHSQLCLSM